MKSMIGDTKTEDTMEARDQKFIMKELSSIEKKVT